MLSEVAEPGESTQSLLGIVESTKRGLSLEQLKVHAKHTHRTNPHCLEGIERIRRDQLPSLYTQSRHEPIQERKTNHSRPRIMGLVHLVGAANDALPLAY